MEKESSYQSFYPCFMLSKNLLDEGAWKIFDDEPISVQVKDGDQTKLGELPLTKLDINTPEWDIFKHLLGVLAGEEPGPCGPAGVRAFVRDVIRSYEGIEARVQPAPFTILFDQGESHGRLMVCWERGPSGKVPPYGTASAPEIIWIQPNWPRREAPYRL